MDLANHLITNTFDDILKDEGIKVKRGEKASVLRFE